MKKNRREKGGVRSLSYMTVSVALFVLGFVITAVLLVLSAVTAGGLGRISGILGTVALAAAAAGFTVPLYGHFIVRMDGKGDWRVGTVLNGLLTLFLVFLYFLGIS